MTDVTWTRDQFALRAMAALIQEPQWWGAEQSVAGRIVDALGRHGDAPNKRDDVIYAIAAYAIADAMLAERSRNIPVEEGGAA